MTLPSSSEESSSGVKALCRENCCSFKEDEIGFSTFNGMEALC